MLGIILATVIPLAYLGAASSIAGYVSRTWTAGGGYTDDFDRVMAAVLVGLFWPVAFPFYFQIRIRKPD